MRLRIGQADLRYEDFGFRTDWAEGTATGTGDALGQQGTIDESGFQFFHPAGFSQRSFLFMFCGKFEQRDNGTRIYIRFRPHLTESIIFLAIIGISIAAATKPPFGLVGGLTAIVMAGIYTFLGWLEWRALISVLKKADCRRVHGAE